MSTKSLVLLVFQFLTMGYLLSGFSISISSWILVVQSIGIVIALSGISAGGIHGFNMQPEVKSDVLITNGIYRYIRNPMYLGILLFFSADLLSRPTLTRMIAFAILIVTLFLKILSEERFLSIKFGDDYAQYKSTSYRLIPFVY
ncbi:MAG: isoprenylcysteine carboxylmethyltransferase family protein [Bacteroidia bacterium]|nr:isoprenylcysteine carboxylmethyltransferase family protein [Bacteroidia bacterium]NND09654.1 isoprenylcysteine carboxylmethyltransferase family protein [Flavobacteriaceae bacterium]NNK28468.1 isoprenylcysteine carboxylmethyltransferase family protein [Flavobacteriaceae bacterium]